MGKRKRGAPIQIGKGTWLEILRASPPLIAETPISLPPSPPTPTAVAAMGNGGAPIEIDLQEVFGASPSTAGVGKGKEAALAPGKFAEVSDAELLREMTRRSRVRPKFLGLLREGLDTAAKAADDCKRDARTGRKSVFNFDTEDEQGEHQVRGYRSSCLKSSDVRSTKKKYGQSDKSARPRSSLIGEESSRIFSTAKSAADFLVQEPTASKRQRGKSDDPSGSKKSKMNKKQKDIADPSTEVPVDVTGTPTAPLASQSPLAMPPLRQLALQLRSPAKLVSSTTVTQHYESSSKDLNFDLSTFASDDDDEDVNMESLVSEIQTALAKNPIQTTPSVAPATPTLSSETLKKLKLLLDALSKNSNELLEDPSPICEAFASIEETLPSECSQAILAACELNKMKPDVDVAKDRLARREAQKSLRNELNALISDANMQYEKYKDFEAAAKAAKSAFGAAVVEVTDLEAALEKAKTNRDIKLEKSKSATSAMKTQRKIAKDRGNSALALKEKIVDVPGTDDDDDKVLDQVQSVLARAVSSVMKFL